MLAWKCSIAWLYFVKCFNIFDQNVQILGMELAAMNGVLVLTLLTVAYICLVLSSLVIDLV
jgi:hypothetical protein